MTFAIIVCTVTLAAIFVAWYLDRVATFGGSDHEGELERRIEEQSAQIAQLVRALESRPERRPAVTRTKPEEPPEPPAAAPVPVPAPESKPDPKPAGHREEPEAATLPKNRSRRAELHQAAKELHAMGMGYKAIGEALGVSGTSARRYVTDRDWKGRPCNAPKSESEPGPQAELDLAPKKSARGKCQIQITKKTRRRAYREREDAARTRDDLRRDREGLEGLEQHRGELRGSGAGRDLRDRRLRGRARPVDGPRSGVVRSPSARDAIDMRRGRGRRRPARARPRCS